MQLILSCIFMLGVAAATYTSFQWESCTVDHEQQALKVVSAEAHPMPVLVPGPLVISFNAEILKQIDEAVLDFKFIRHTTFGQDIVMPCVGGIGSCTLDGCSIVDYLINGTRDSQKDLGRQLKAMFESVGIFSSCPILVQNVTISAYTINIPKLGSALDLISDGDYTVSATARNPTTNATYGCFKFNVSFNRRHTGWLVGKRRH